MWGKENISKGNRYAGNYIEKNEEKIL